MYIQSAPDLQVGDNVIVSVRPEDIIILVTEDEVNKYREQFVNILPAKVLRKVFVGPYLRIDVDIGISTPFKIDVYGTKLVIVVVENLFYPVSLEQRLFIKTIAIKC